MIHFHLATEIARLSHLSYGGMFLAILASGHVIPIPEAVTLILLGAASVHGHIHLVGVCVVAILTAVLVDLVIYALALGGSELITHYSKHIKLSLIERYAKAEERHLFFLILASHFVPGWRLANPIIAGMTQMPAEKFALYTLISSLIYAPFFVLIGFMFRSHILPVIAAIESVRDLFLVLLLVSIAVLIIVYNTHHHAKE